VLTSHPPLPSKKSPAGAGSAVLIPRPNTAGVAPATIMIDAATRNGQVGTGVDGVEGVASELDPDMLSLELDDREEDCDLLALSLELIVGESEWLSELDSDMDSTIDEDCDSLRDWLLLSEVECEADCDRESDED